MNRITIVIALAVVTMSPGFALACSCKGPPPPKRALESSAAVFVGKVTKVEQIGSRRVATLEVTSNWKGIKEKLVVVETGLGGGDCGYGFHEGESYLIYAYRTKGEDGKPGPLRTNICTRTRPLAKARGDIKALGVSKMPPA